MLGNSESTSAGANNYRALCQQSSLLPLSYSFIKHVPTQDPFLWSMHCLLFEVIIHSCFHNEKKMAAVMP